VKSVGRRSAVLAASLLTGFLGAAAPPSFAQGVSAIHVGADNDAFSFWMPPWARGDAEYTSGVRGMLEYAGESRWLARPARALRAIGARGRVSEPTVTTRAFGIGQAIYTGAVPASALVATTAPGNAAAGSTVAGTFPAGSPEPTTRLNAGWLFASAMQRDSTDERQTELRVDIGVVGPPALGEPMQRFFHSLAPEFNRPIDWARQLPFEPALVARWSDTRRVMARSNGGRLEAASRLQHEVAAGTILIEGAAAGVMDGRFTPHRRATNRWVPALAASVGLRGRVILRDEFLDGTFFRRSDWERRRWVVPDLAFTLRASAVAFDLSYRAIFSGKQSLKQVESANWGSLDLRWFPGRQP